MPTDLEQQLARFAEAIDREAPTIAFDDTVGRGTVAVDVDLLEREVSDRASRVDGVSWIDTTPSHDEIGERDVLIELAPALVVHRPAWRRIALKVSLAAAAVAVLVLTVTAIERGGDELEPADDFPNPTTTFVSPRNGFSIKHPDGAAITPAKDSWGFTAQVDDAFDVVDTGLAAVFKGASRALPERPPEFSDDQVEEYISALVEDVLPGGCGVPRSQQVEITIDGQPVRIAECANRIEATVFPGGRIYLFTLLHDRSDARAVFDAFVATIDLHPETAVDFPNMATRPTFVSPTYGYSFRYIDRGGLAPAAELWDPANQQFNVDFDDRFDGVETGYGAYFAAASTEIPEGVSIDAWVDDYVSPGDCGARRSQQREITIDGQSGRIMVCASRIEATVVAGGRLYYFILLHSHPGDGRAWFDAWVATIDLTPETAT